MAGTLRASHSNLCFLPSMEVEATKRARFPSRELSLPHCVVWARPESRVVDLQVCTCPERVHQSHSWDSEVKLKDGRVSEKVTGVHLCNESANSFMPQGHQSCLVSCPWPCLWLCELFSSLSVIAFYRLKFPELVTLTSPTKP